MNEEPLITVLITVYNGEKTIKQTLESVLAQTYTNMQIIVVDDKSSDSSRIVVDKFDDKRIEKVYLKKNRNVCVALGEGFKRIKGEYLALIGHDDIWLPQKIEKQIAYLQSNKNVVACFSRVDIIDENSIVSNDEWPYLTEWFSTSNRTRQEWLFTLLTSVNCFCGATPLIRKSAIDMAGGYRKGLLQLQDYDMWLRLLLIGDIYILDEKLVLYRRNRNNTKNLSSVTQESTNRTSHERNYVIYDIMLKMDDKLFKDAFKEHFKNVEASSKEEILCEKALILIALENCFAFKFLIELFESEECMRILEEKCDFDINKFYEYNGTAIQCDYTYENLYKMQNELIEKMKKAIEKT